MEDMNRLAPLDPEFTRLDPEFTRDWIADLLTGWHIDPDWSGSSERGVLGGTYTLTRHDAEKMARQIVARLTGRRGME